MSRRGGFIAMAAIAATILLALVVTLTARDRDDRGGGVAAGGPYVYVAVGASDSVGVGAGNPSREAWPVVFVEAALPPATIFTNVAVPGAKVADALRDQVPKAVAADPDLVTVWLNVNDLRALVEPATYRSQLRQLVEALRRDGETTVLVANTPEIDQLPALKSLRLPQALIEARVDEYNDAVADVVEETGAVLVDLHAQSERFEADGRIAELTSGDGFHPNTAGYREVARVFAETYENEVGGS